MGVRGRKSAAELAIVRSIKSAPPPEPPAELTKDQKRIWCEIVVGEPPELFRAAAAKALLADYCRHRDTAELLAAEIDRFRGDWLREPGGPERLSLLCRTRDREVRAGVSLLTKLRCTNQSRILPRGAGVLARDAPRGPRPWD